MRGKKEKGREGLRWDGRGERGEERMRSPRWKEGKKGGRKEGRKEGEHVNNCQYLCLYHYCIITLHIHCPHTNSHTHLT